MTPIVVLWLSNAPVQATLALVSSIFAPSVLVVHFSLGPTACRVCCLIPGVLRCVCSCFVSRPLIGAQWPSWRIVPLGFQNSTPCLSDLNCFDVPLTQLKPDQHRRMPWDHHVSEAVEHFLGCLGWLPTAPHHTTESALASPVMSQPHLPPNPHVKTKNDPPPPGVPIMVRPGTRSGSPVHPNWPRGTRDSKLREGVRGGGMSVLSGGL